MLKAMGLAGVAVALFAVPADAHHSFAMFDQTKVVALEGTVTEFEWVNPHSWLHFTVRGPDGREQDWSLELASTGQQMRAGWRQDTIKAGDQIKVEFNPLKDGSRGGTLLNAVLPDGRKLGHGGMPANPLGNN